MKFVVWNNGDDSVGICGDRAWIDMQIDELDIGEELEYVDEIKSVLAKAFSDIWGMRSYCATEEELRGSQDEQL